MFSLKFCINGKKIIDVGQNLGGHLAFLCSPCHDATKYKTNRMLLWSNSKSHTCFRLVLRLVPKSATLNDLERPLRTSSHETCIFWSLPGKFINYKIYKLKDKLTLSAAEAAFWVLWLCDAIFTFITYRTDFDIIRPATADGTDSRTYAHKTNAHKTNAHRTNAHKTNTHRTNAHKIMDHRTNAHNTIWNTDKCSPSSLLVFFTYS